MLELHNTLTGALKKEEGKEIGYGLII